MKYRITTQKQLRREFWATFPKLPKIKIPDDSGLRMIYTADTRMAFVDWLDGLEKSGEISEALAQSATL